MCDLDALPHIFDKPTIVSHPAEASYYLAFHSDFLSSWVQGTVLGRILPIGGVV